MGKQQFGDLIFEDGAQEGKLVEQVISGTEEAMNTFLAQAAFDKDIISPTIINTKIVFEDSGPSVMVVIKYQRRVCSDGDKKHT